jgi:competence protein ComEA
MSRRQNLIADYFTFSKSQRNGIFVAIAVMAVCAVVKFGYGFFFSSKTVPADAEFAKKVAALKLTDTNSYANNYTRNNKRYNNYYNKDDDENYNEPSHKNGTYTIKGELFEFDPNTIDAAGWKRLGVRDKTIATIQNYLSKGGKFRKADDIKRIYGLFPDEAERLLPYVKIARAENTAYTPKTYDNTTNESTPTYTKPTYTPKTIDINTADTTALISLPGIGSKLAARIINYRVKLGGFSSVNQLAETYGVPDSTFQKIKGKLVFNGGIRQLNINTADANTLKVHPYIKWNIANAIVQYRTQHGNYSSIADLKKIEIIDEQTFNKIAPYLTL